MVNNEKKTVKVVIQGDLYQTHLDSLSIRDSRDPYDYNSYGGDFVGQTDYNTESEQTRTTSSYAQANNPNGI